MKNISAGGRGGEGGGGEGRGGEKTRFSGGFWSTPNHLTTPQNGTKGAGFAH